MTLMQMTLSPIVVDWLAESNQCKHVRSYDDDEKSSDEFLNPLGSSCVAVPSLAFSVWWGSGWHGGEWRIGVLGIAAAVVFEISSKVTHWERFVYRCNRRAQAKLKRSSSRRDRAKWRLGRVITTMGVAYSPGFPTIPASPSTR